MSRTKIVQVAFSEEELRVLSAEAALARLPDAAYCRYQLVGNRALMARAAVFPSLDAARAANIFRAPRSSATEEVSGSEFEWPLLVSEICGNEIASVWEVTTAAREAPVGLGLPKGARVAICDSPWPYRVIERFHGSTRRDRMFLTLGILRNESLLPSLVSHIVPELFK